jgi:hypothetical protein
MLRVIEHDASPAQLPGSDALTPESNKPGRSILAE